MAQINNIRTVSVPSIGKLPLAENPGSFTPSGKKREHKAGRLAEDGGWIGSSRPARLELNINLLSGIDVQALNDIENEDVTVRLGDGTVYTMFQAFVEEPIPVDSGESKITIIANVSEKVG